VPALCTREAAEREIAEKLGAKWLALERGLYPRLLAELEDAPPLLIAKGNLNLLDSQAVAIVGARNASPLRAASRTISASTISAGVPSGREGEPCLSLT
jgi:DNA processing protein